MKTRGELSRRWARMFGCVVTLLTAGVMMSCDVQVPDGEPDAGLPTPPTNDNEPVDSQDDSDGDEDAGDEDPPGEDPGDEEPSDDTDDPSDDEGGDEGDEDEGDDGDDKPGDEPKGDPFALKLAISDHLDTPCGLYPFSQQTHFSTVLLNCYHVDEGPPPDRIVWNQVAGEDVRTGPDEPNPVRFLSFMSDDTAVFECTATRGEEQATALIEVPLAEIIHTDVWVGAWGGGRYRLDQEAFLAGFIESTDGNYRTDRSPAALHGQSLGDGTWRCVSGPSGPDGCDLIELTPIDGDYSFMMKYRIASSPTPQVMMSGTGETRFVSDIPLPGEYVFELTGCWEDFGEADLARCEIIPQLEFLESGSERAVLNGIVLAPGQPREFEVLPLQEIEVRFIIAPKTSLAVTLSSYDQQGRGAYPFGRFDVSPEELTDVFHISHTHQAPFVTGTYSLRLTSYPIDGVPVGITITVREEEE